MRIVSLCPSNTEIAAYLGLTNQLVGVDDYSDWPGEVKNLPKVGPDLSIDMDKVEALQPDVILASLSVPGMEKNIEKLKARSLPYIVSSPNSLDDVRRDLLHIGDACGQYKKAQTVVSRMDHIVSDYKQKAANCKPIRVYWEWWPKPAYSPGGANWLTTISRLAGAQNVLENRSEASCQVTWEEIKQLNPDHICLAWVGILTEKVKPELLYKREGWPSMTALRERNIHVLEESLYCRPSPRLIIGLQKLAYRLHPDVFPNPNNKDPLFIEH
ncbi:iron complex transport system substrate-binding protein [Alteribacillus persepolensis]|uniref:Iron complex transport system substrate-binding protein n=1 Tax=Alteribacillus persepolensis TaxID=568899 RepID=A0A1G8DZF6_9BACI|nr:cobalamin-binding protein [Alteribacillus persepolensis]SDH62951.1 iron complex transport system substrate-binding protein [Alteribacillus persepolensis]